MLAVAVLSRSDGGAAGAERYAGFEMRYRPFASESPYPWRLDMVRERAYDLTSLFYEQREDVAKLLRRARGEARFDDFFARLYVRLGKEAWGVDVHGVVLSDGKAHRLSAKDFVALRQTIVGAIPESADENADLKRLRDSLDPLSKR